MADLTDILMQAPPNELVYGDNWMVNACDWWILVELRSQTESIFMFAILLTDVGEVIEWKIDIKKSHERG